MEGGESWSVDSEKGRGSGRKTLEGEAGEVVDMMGMEGLGLGMWVIREERLEDVDWMKVVMRLLKLWDSVGGAINKPERDRERERAVDKGGLLTYQGRMWMTG